MTDTVDPIGSDIVLSVPNEAASAILLPEAELLRVAVEHERAGRLDEAETILNRILATESGQPDALHLSGIVAWKQGRRSMALGLMRRSLTLNPEVPLYWRNIAEALRIEGHLDEALNAGRRAVALGPRDPIAFANLAVIHAERRELNESKVANATALALDPHCASAHFGLAETLLLRGQWEQGWEHYRWRFRLPGADVNLPPGGGVPWDGRPLASGRLLVIADQGYGDAIQFGRYLPRALELCPGAVVAAGRDLHGVLRQLGATTLVDNWREVGEVDAIVTLSGLPRLFGARVDAVLADIPYLSVDRSLRRRWAARLAALTPPGAPRVGLVWAGRPTHANDRRRSAPLAALAPLFATRGVTFISLQKGERQAEIAGYFGPAPLLGLGPELATWEDTMATIAELDAVVTVDTAVAHLAGALGRPTHVMLAHASEWRWLLERDDSPWYPTLKLHRQPAPGDWASVARSVARALPAIADQRR